MAKYEKVGIIFNGGCSSLKSIKLSPDLEYISGHAFEGCTSLTSITIPEGATYIYNSAFAGCVSLKSITIPKTVTKIENNAIGKTADPANIEGFAIYGCKGTAAEQYAKENGIKFIALKYTPGDADTSGEVTVDDVLLIQQNIAGWDVKIDETNADVDGDGELSVSDALFVQQIIAGWKITQ